MSRTRLERTLRKSGFSRRMSRRIAYTVIYGYKPAGSITDVADLLFAETKLSDDEAMTAAIAVWRSELMQDVDIR